MCLTTMPIGNTNTSSDHNRLRFTDILLMTSVGGDGFGWGSRSHQTLLSVLPGYKVPNGTKVPP